MASKCPYDPKDMAGQPIGMYHCPLCGDMVVAGMAHPDYDKLDDYIELNAWQQLALELYRECCGDRIEGTWEELMATAKTMLTKAELLDG